MLSAHVFLYHTAPAGTYTQPVCVVLELGFVQTNIGNDYEVSSTVASESGDYFGFGLESIAKDINYHGFEDSNILVSYINAGSSNSVAGVGDIIKISFNRAVFTGDVYDVNITSVQHMCVTLFTSGTLSSSATNTACTDINMPILYPVMTVNSAVQVWLPKIIYYTVFAAVVLLVM